LYENFAKFSKSEVLHFQRLEQQRKGPKHNEASRLACYSENKPHNNYPKHVNNIDSNHCGPLEIWDKNFGPPPQERKERALDYMINQYNQRGGMVVAEAHSSLCIVCTTEKTQTTVPKTTQFSWNRR
jgi:hypothetical protein